MRVFKYPLSKALIYDFGKVIYSGYRFGKGKIDEKPLKNDYKN